ncbi:MAG: TetR/AcrR family transcriptional regulator [Coriobacteriaceae bacterium]|nr:TetR/AcrR family transcriptional regulator [Coriobacteriaceae bacterium]
MANYQRARTPERKRERMDTIMAAADELFQTRPYHQVNMGAIAERLGWSRSNLYKYAATQEEIFLELHSAKNRAWLDDLAASLADAPLPTDDFARIWAQVTEQHADFLRYQEILTSIIESNVTLERLTEFKKAFAEMLAPVVAVLARQCAANEATANALYLRLLYQAPGLWSHFHCAELTREAMRAAGLPEVEGTFVDAYADFVALCIQHV